jgi:hypothetical protein
MVEAAGIEKSRYTAANRLIRKVACHRVTCVTYHVFVSPTSHTPGDTTIPGGYFGAGKSPCSLSLGWSYTTAIVDMLSDMTLRKSPAAGRFAQGSKTAL